MSPPPVRRIVDTTGAGDAFLGGLIAGLKAKRVPSSPESLRYSPLQPTFGPTGSHSASMLLLVSSVHQVVGIPG